LGFENTYHYFYTVPKDQSYLANDIININPAMYVSIPPNTKASKIKYKSK